MTRLDAYSGATLAFQMACQDTLGAAFDLTGWVAFGSIMTQTAGGVEVVNLAPEIATPANGIITINLLPATTANVPTGQYVWQIAITNGTDIIPIEGGTIKFKPLQAGDIPS